MTDITFEPQSKAAWLDKVLKDLKGAEYDTVQCSIEPGVILDPLYTADEVIEYPAIYWPSQDESWKIVESFELNSGTHGIVLNSEMLECLEGGTEVLEIIVDNESVFDPYELFVNVHLEMVIIRMTVNETNKMKMRNFIREYVDENEVKIEAIQVVFSDEKQMLKMASSEFLSDDLTTVLNHVQKACKLNPNLGWENVIIDVPIGNELLITISKLRALKLLLYSFADEMEMPFDAYPILSARIEAEIVNVELESIIERGTKALGAVLGGIDEMHIAWGFATDMKMLNRDKQRVSRNIHWLIKSECELGQLADPLNGSYWIEQCTQKLVELAWEKYKGGGEC